jgi:hypothetical protein
MTYKGRNIKAGSKLFLANKMFVVVATSPDIVSVASGENVTVLSYRQFRQIGFQAAKPVQRFSRNWSGISKLINETEKNG